MTPDDASGYSNRGYAYRKIGDYAAAVDDYTAAIRKSGGTIRLHNNKAYCLAKLGKYVEAIRDYEAVIRLDPSNVHAYHNRYAWPPSLSRQHNDSACTSCLFGQLPMAVIV